MTAAEVARELWPKLRSVVRCFGLGGVEGSWVVARRRDRWRVRVLGLEITAALLCDTLSLIMPIRFAKSPMIRKISTYAAAEWQILFYLFKRFERIKKDTGKELN